MKSYRFLVGILVLAGTQAYAVDFSHCKAVGSTPFSNVPYGIQDDGTLSYDAKSPDLISYKKEGNTETLKYRLNTYDISKHASIKVPQTLVIKRNSDGTMASREDILDPSWVARTEKWAKSDKNSNSPGMHMMVSPYSMKYLFSYDPAGRCYPSQTSIRTIENPKKDSIVYDADMCEELNQSFSQISDSCSRAMVKLSGIYEKYQSRFRKEGKELVVSGFGSTFATGVDPYDAAMITSGSCKIMASIGGTAHVPAEVPASPAEAAVRNQSAGSAQ